MMTRTAALVLLLFGTTAGAQSIDYDPRRAVELRPCDDHRYHGRTEQARACYTKLLDSQTPIVQAEAAWAIGDIQRANQIFRDAVQNNERAVQLACAGRDCFFRRTSTPMPSTCSAKR